MAVRLDSARITFLQAVREFPRWMSIRKRPEKSVSGLFLQSVIEEQTDIIAELEKFIKEFFLISYVGKESEIADYVYIVQVGDINVSDSTLIKPVLELTDNPRYFMDNMKISCLYQGGYLIIDTSNVPDSGTLLYSYNGYKYGGRLQRYHIWNIFDEFAMFLGLERYSDVGETNAQLLKRCFLVFSNPTNSTKQGLKNTIINCVSNDITLENDDIRIEVPDDNNAWLSSEDFGTVYEHFVQLNKDIFRTKIWDTTWWEHTFKQLGYLSHVWDKPIDVYQDGTGQMGDLQVKLSQNVTDTTDITVKGFKKDTVTINNYFHKQNIRQEIPLTFTKYKDTLKPRRVQYKITAVPTIRINPEQINLREQVRTEGYSKFYLQDIVSNSGYANVIRPGELIKGRKYELVFKGSDPYSDMAINKADLVEWKTITDLRQENRVFKMSGDVLQHVDIKQHINRVYDLKSYENLIDTLDGFTLGKDGLTATFSVDVTGCGGKTVKIASYGDMFDVTEQTDRWTLSGLKIENGRLFSDTEVPDKSSAILDISCMGFSINLLKGTGIQGSVDIKVYVNGELNSTLSKLITTPGVTEHWFDTMSDIRIEFTKSGSYPFEMEVKATKYELTYKLTTGTFIQGPVSQYLSNVPVNTPNTLTVTVKSYDVKPPTIRYIHIGPSTSRASYTIKDIIPTTDEAYLDIDTNCKVSLYEIRGNDKVLISDNFVTKWVYSNNTDDSLYLEVNVQQFSEIATASKIIHKTARAGTTVSYITLQPGEAISDIVISGVTFRDRALRSLATLLNVQSSWTVYVASTAQGFIIRDTTTSEEWFTDINRDSLTTANIFTYENLPSGVEGIFVVDKPNDIKAAANSYSRNFESTYLISSEEQQYISYNELDMYKSVVGETEDINIVNSLFAPILPNNEMMLYYIDPIESLDGFTTTAVFKKYRYGVSNYFNVPASCRTKLQQIQTMIDKEALQSTIEKVLDDIRSSYSIDIVYSAGLYDVITDMLEGGRWSLGRKEIYVTTDFDFGNTDDYGVSTSAEAPVFSISSEVKLPRMISVNGVEQDIATFIVTAPSTMQVIYEEDSDIIENGLIIKNDGFNKLKYSNVKEIAALYVNGIAYNDYTLLKQEGIIVWNNLRENSDIIGQTFSVAYVYQVPTTLTYKDLSSMYEMVNYNLDAYLPVPLASKLDTALEDGDTCIVEFTDKVDFVAAPECSNPNFIATYNAGTVTVRRIYTRNVALVQAGYYYDEGKEYYYYNNEHIDNVDKFRNITLHNVKKLDAVFQFILATSNYLLNSEFKPSNNYEKLCYVDMDDPMVDSTGISKLDIITACETLNMWRTSNMEVSLTTGLKGIGILFSAESATGYAIMNITKYIIPGMLISLFITQDIKISLYREVKANDDSMAKTVFAEPFDIFVQHDTFWGYKVPDDINTDYKYFLVVTGTGVIDDIIVKQDYPLEDHFNLHVKNIENFGFEISEREDKGYLVPLVFEQDGCILTRLEIDKANKIQIGSNVDYGVTQIFSSNDRYDDIIAPETITKQKGTFITSDKKSSIKTPLFYVENSANVTEIYVKINDLVVDKMKNFNVKAFTTNSEEGLNATTLGYVQKTNLATFSGSQLRSYLQVEIEMDPNKVISSLEIFVRYAELGVEPLIVQNHLSGEVITKVFDVITENNYVLRKIEGTFKNKGNINIFMRGCKQDSKSMVWTQWYPVETDYDLTSIHSPHIFDNYRLFQFKIELLDPTAEITVNNFILEVV